MRCAARPRNNRHGGPGAHLEAGLVDLRRLVVEAPASLPARGEDVAGELGIRHNERGACATTSLDTALRCGCHVCKRPGEWLRVHCTCARTHQPC